MNKIIVLLIALTLFSCDAQKKKGMGYADENFKATESASKAKYYMIKKFAEPDYMPSFNPTGDGFIQGYGYSINLTPVMTELDHYFFEYYDFNDKKVLEAKAIVLRSNGDFELDGPAYFFHENGKVKVKTNFENTKLSGRYTVYDENEKYVSHTYYMNGKKFTPKVTDKRVLGKWRAETKIDEIDYYLYNEVFEDGLMIITSQLVPYDVGFGEVTGEPVVTEVLWSYNKTGADKGDMTIYNYDGSEIGTDEIVFIDNDTFTSIITKHADPDIVGEKYEFIRMK